MDSNAVVDAIEALITEVVMDRQYEDGNFFGVREAKARLATLLDGAR